MSRSFVFISKARCLDHRRFHDLAHWRGAEKIAADEIGPFVKLQHSAGGGLVAGYIEPIEVVGMP